MPASIELIKELSGHSGCRVSLYGGSSLAFVRKESPNVLYNSRLINQMEKQIRFHDSYGNCPRVLSSGYIEAMFYFDMEYLVGDSISSIIQRSDLVKIDSIAIQICEVLLDFSRRVSGKLPRHLFEKKILEIRQATIFLSPEIRENAEACLSFLEASNWLDIPFGFCHGDLTLENMLVGRDGRLLLIDFLDGPLQSPWLDLAKIHQDCVGLWFLRMPILSSQVPPDTTHIMMMLRLLTRQMKTILNTAFSDAYGLLHALTVLQLMRALPYASDISTQRFIVQSSKRLMMDWKP